MPLKVIVLKTNQLTCHSFTVPVLTFRSAPAGVPVPADQPLDSEIFYTDTLPTGQKAQRCQYWYPGEFVI